MMQKWGRGQGFGRLTNYSQYDVWNFKGEVDEQDYRHKDVNWFEMEVVGTAIQGINFMHQI